MGDIIVALVDRHINGPDAEFVNRTDIGATSDGPPDGGQIIGPNGIK